MEFNRMTEDSWLVASIMIVWFVIALLYQTLPMLDMPPGKRIWGISAILFLVLTWAIATAETERE